ncbi:MAG: ATP-binding protein [Chloroflexi bacterium]|nr:ATP-binding protein [Chloroflexota bacterium]
MGKTALFPITLKNLHQPLLQYELDFNPEFTQLDESIRGWLKQMSMEVYVPVSGGKTMDGLFAIGPKRSGVPYQPGELELIQILADQTVVALQNARLYSELGQQNEQINQLNVDLVQQNERLEIMDQVKSDFITIASHGTAYSIDTGEGLCRYPLSYERGQCPHPRTDPRDCGSYQPGHHAPGNAHHRHARCQPDRCGWHASDLHGGAAGHHCAPGHGAVEPGNSRAAYFVYHPKPGNAAPIQADFKRLVQTFTNVLGNALKYTPDRGSIAVEGFLIPSENGQDDRVEIVISDTGIGIDPKYHELIFEKFFRIETRNCIPRAAPSLGRGARAGAAHRPRRG